jgi:hypothetical protein
VLVLRSEFGDLLFLKDNIREQPLRAREKEIHHFEQGINALSSSLDKMHDYVPPLRHAVELFAKQEKEEEK